jgi:dienelactone hydrolase
LWLGCSQAPVEDSAPRFEITPNRAICDEPVKAYLLNLKPDQHVTVRASAGIFQSELEFAADAQGRVDLGAPAPEAAREGEVAPFRILWSMKRDPDARNGLPKKGTPDSTKVTFSAFVHGKEVANGSFEQLYVSPDVERIPVNDQGLRGVFYKPKAKGRYAGLMLLSGSEGGLNERRAGLLASHGYAVLALAYFDYEDLPKQMVEVPLEYFETGLQWLQRQESVQGDRLAVIGGSRGGELGLLLGARFPQITAVVAYVPSHVVWPESTDPRVVQRAAWTYKGKPVPNMGSAQVDRGEANKVLNANPDVMAIAPIFQLYLKDVEAVRQATIPVEEIRGPVLLVTGKEDQVWPAAQMADLVMQRLAAHKHPYRDQHLCYANCGHAIGNPNAPIGETRVRSRGGEVFELGGTPQGSGYAAWDSWPRVLKFLDENLNQKK